MTNEEAMTILKKDADLLKREIELINRTMPRHLKKVEQYNEITNEHKTDKYRFVSECMTAESWITPHDHIWKDSVDTSIIEFYKMTGQQMPREEIIECSDEITAFKMSTRYSFSFFSLLTKKMSVFIPKSGVIEEIPYEIVNDGTYMARLKPNPAKAYKDTVPLFDLPQASGAAWGRPTEKGLFLDTDDGGKTLYWASGTETKKGMDKSRYDSLDWKDQLKVQKNLTIDRLKHFWKHHKKAFGAGALVAHPLGIFFGTLGGLRRGREKERQKSSLRDRFRIPKYGGYKSKKSRKRRSRSKK